MTTLRSRVVVSIGAVLALVVCVAGRAAHGDESPVRVTDFLRLRVVAAVEVQRDGRRAVVVVRSLSPEEWKGDDARYQYRSHLWLVELGDDAPPPRPLTFGEARDSEPALSPDGSQVAFVRTPQAPAPVGAGSAPGSGTHSATPNRGADGSANIWVLPLDGGEARQVTFFAEGASEPSWSPDGRLLTLVSPVPLADLDQTPTWPLERPGRRWNDEPFTGTRDAPSASGTPSPDGDAESQRAWLARNASRANPLVVNRLDFHEESSLRTKQLFEQVFVVDPAAPEAPPRRVTGAVAPHRNPHFIDGGRRVIFGTVRASKEHLDRTLEGEIWSAGVDGRDERAVAAMPGWSFEEPRPTPDGALIGFKARQIDEPAFRPWLLALVPTTISGAVPDPIWLSTNLDRSVEQWGWWSGVASPVGVPNAGAASAPAGGGAIFTAASEGGIPLYAINEGLPAPVPLAERSDGQPIGVYAFGAGAGTVLFARTTPQQPCVLVRRDARGERVVLDLNPWTARRALSMPEMKWIERDDKPRDRKYRVQMFAMPPTQRTAGKRVPTIVAIHGGPGAMWGPGELTLWHEFQWLCGRGYGVVYCNPRGSEGYGAEFVRANRQDWGPGPSGDVLAAVDAALALDWVDPERLVLTGGSYGGYLTAFTITRDDRFKAAVADRGVYDLGTFFGEGNAWRLVQWAFGGTPFDPRFQQVFDRNGILRSLPRVKTPLLIMHGSGDLRTGVAQSEMLYRALRVLGKPVEYVRYPAADHDMSRRGEPKQRIDRLLRTAEFFERFVGPPASSPR